MYLRYLHLSDLHLTGQASKGEDWAAREFNQDFVTALMLEVVERLVPPDLIFITGDLARHGQSAEYQVVEIFVERLLAVTGLPAERLFLVPGNHDVDRSQVEKRHLKWWYDFEELDEITDILGSSTSFPVLMRKFAAFRDFAGRVLGRQVYGERDYFFAGPVTVPKGDEEILVNVLGLNSALFAGYDGDDQQKLAFGLPQVGAALQRLDAGALLTVTLCHHPFECFHPADKMCKNMLLQKADLILAGHLHKPDNLFVRGAAGQAVFVSAGASFETRERENSFNVVEIDLESGAGRVQFYKYLPDFHRWKENTDANPDHQQGLFEFTIERIAHQFLPAGATTTPVLGRHTRFINPPPIVPPSHFQNRYFELELLSRFLKDEACRLITVVGRAGVGKTTMVCLLLKSLESGRLPDLGTEELNGSPFLMDGIVYLSAVGVRRVNLPNLYAGLLKLLPQAAATELDMLYKNPQVSTTVKMEALLAAFPRGRVAMLLDNFEELIDPETYNLRDAELDEALRALLAAPHHAVKMLLTTRVAPRWLLLVEPGRQARLELGEGLASPHAENVLRAMDADGTVGLKTAPDELLAEARVRTRGYPRALEALYAILSADRHTTLAEVLTRAEDYLPEEVVEKLVGQAFSRLDETARQVMHALAVYDRPVTPAAVDHLLQPYWPGADSALVLNRLVTMHLVRKEGARYHLHPVDRTYVFTCIPIGDPTDGDQSPIPNPQFTQYVLLHRAAEYYRQARKPRAEWRTLDDLAPQLDEFDLRCASGEYEVAAEVLLEIGFDYLFLWGHYRLMISLYERLQGKLGDPRLKMLSMAHLGAACHHLGQVREAIDYHEKALSIAREVQDRSREAKWLGNLGICYAALGQTVHAVEYHEQALVVAREIGDRRGEGTHLSNLGNCYASLGQTARAVEYYEQALSLAREIGDRRVEGNALGNLGNRYAALGQTARAIGVYEQALVITREIGYRDGESRHLTCLGSCYYSLGQTARAIEYYEQALAVAREIDNRRGEGNNLSGLGLCYTVLGQMAHAVEFHEQALAIAREIGDRDGEGRYLGNLAGILIDEGRYAEAIQHATESIRIGEEIGNPMIGNWSNGHIALVHLYTGDLSTARAAAEAARQHDEPRHNYYTLALLGLVALRQGDRAAAQEAFTAAVTQADALLSHTPQFYDALDSKGLALCGLALLGEEAPESFGGPWGLAQDAYRAARLVNRDAGVVRRVLCLFDALAAAVDEGRLAVVRAAAAGVE